MNQHFWWIFIILLSGKALVAQTGFYTEEEVKQSEAFLIADQNRIMGNYDQAIEAYQELLKSGDDNPAIHFAMARVLYAQDKPVEAIEQVQQAVDAEPKNVWYLSFLADLLQADNQFVKSAGFYERLRELEPENPDHYYQEAYQYVRANDLKSALKTYDALEKTQGLSEELARRRSALYMRMGDPKKAEKELNGLVEKYPRVQAYHWLLVDFYQETKNQNGMRSALTELQKLNPEDAEIELALASLSADGTVNQQQALERLLGDPQVPLDRKIQELLPSVQKVNQSGSAAEAKDLVPLVQVLATTHPASAKAQAIYGDVLTMAGKKDEAMVQYAKTVELDQSVFLVWEQLLYLLKETGDYKGLIQRSNAALEVFPNQAIVYLFNAEGHLMAGDLAEAEYALEQAGFMTSGNPALAYQTSILKGRVAEAKGDFAQAKLSFEAATTAQPKVGTAPYYQALMLMATDKQAAETLLAKALKLDLPEVLQQSAQGLTAGLAGDAAKVDAAFAKALALQNNGEVLWTYGRALQAAGQLDAAKDQWQKAVEMGVNYAPLKKAL